MKRIEQGEIEYVTLPHPWLGAKRYDVCAGRTTLSDFAGRLVEAFSLGGELTIAEQENTTHCRFTSPTPIFDLASPFTAATG